MVGFAGETEEEFKKSLAFVKEIGFAQMHVFKYSVRRGTAAEKMPGHVPETVKSERSAAMLAAAQSMKDDFCRKYIGKTVEILADTNPSEGIYHGYTANYTEVSARSAEDIRGQLASVKIDGLKDGILRGSVIS